MAFRVLPTLRPILAIRLGSPEDPSAARGVLRWRRATPRQGAGSAPGRRFYNAISSLNSLSGITRANSTASPLANKRTTRPLVDPTVTGVPTGGATGEA